MDKAYEPKKCEGGISQKWSKEKISLAKMKSESKTGKSFTVPIPPPNVTGQLHLGHAMMLVIQDIMTRYHRMKGDSTLWLPGTDHAAIATESVVLKNLGVSSREEFTREEFMEKCFDHTKKTHATITNQIKKMGASCDFTRERYTMDRGLSNAVWKIFKDLYDQDLIVRGHRMVNWSTKAQSVLADDELEYEDQKDSFAYIRCGKFVMGTVRSETKCADSPLVLHPEEKYVVARFASPSMRGVEGGTTEEFIFSEVLFDDTERRNKIFNQLGEGTWEKISTHPGKYFEGEKFSADTYVGKREFFVLCDDEVIDINKGTGAMTISVCHSADDYLLAKKYPEQLKSYYFEKIGFDGNMTSFAGELEGDDVKKARKRAVKIMLEKKLIVGLEKDYLHNVPLCYRTGCVVEPMISPQWFIDVNKEFDWVEGVGAVKNQGKILGDHKGTPLQNSIEKKSLKKLTLEAITAHGGDINLIPDRFTKIYDQWIDNLQDWCISRQIWWGHQIPIWYDEEGNEHVAQEQKILFVRHGESEDNKNNIIGGDSSLTEKGKKQAEELAEKIISEKKNISKIYCSSLQRSKETAEIIAKKLDIPVEEFPDFHEIFAGSLENKPRQDLNRSSLHTMQKLQTGETFEEIETRAKKFWKNISKKGCEDGDILCVCHNTFTSQIFGVKDGCTSDNLLDYRDRWSMKNGEIKEVLWMMKPIITKVKCNTQNFEKYLQNIEEVLQTEETDKRYEKNKFYEIGEISPSTQKELGLQVPTVVMSEFIYAKIKNWIPTIAGHRELDDGDIYMLPYLLSQEMEIYENKETKKRYLLFASKKEKKNFVIILDTTQYRNELVTFFFTNHIERYINNLQKTRYTKKKSLEGPASVPSCITTNLRKDLKRLVAGFASRQTLNYLNVSKFFQSLQENNPTLTQDTDTLDTWFSSALWPFSTLGWPDKTPDFENFFPTSVLETGHDILFFWVARMIMFSRFSTGKNPFKDVYLHGLVCDEKGKKMSKSKGNGIDPLEMIEKFGTDAVRMSLVVGTTPGNQVNLGEKKIEGYRNFANKLWNISRYILAMENNGRDTVNRVSTLPEQWIRSKLQILIEEVSAGIENHKYGEVGQKLYDFTWNDLADWAIESAKVVESETIGDTLRYVLENLLKLLHPYIPFVTEKIWEEMGNTSVLALEEFPIANSQLTNKQAEEQFEILQSVIGKIRSLRSAAKVDPVKKITAVLQGENIEFLKENEKIIALLARLESLEFGEKPEEECVEDIASGTQIFLPLAGMLDMKKEAARKEKELEDAKKMLKNLEGRLANKKYVESAPAPLVQQTRDQYKEIQKKISVLES